MRNRLLKIRNIFSDEKLENLDNQKLIKEINHIYQSSTNELNILNNKIKKIYKKENNLFNNYNELNIYEEKNQQFSSHVQIEKETTANKSTKNKNLIMYNETLLERQKEYESIYR